MYESLSNRELASVLNNRNSLVYPSKLSLKNELDKRTLFVDSEEYQNLMELIHSCDNQIKNFEHLGDLGLNVVEVSQNHFQFKRSRLAKFIDILTILIGTLFLYFSVKGLPKLIYLNFDGFGALEYILIIIFFLVGIAGFMLANNGINRFIEFLGFNFEIKNNFVFLTKRIGFKLLRIENEISNLNLSKHASSVSLNIENTEIIRVRNSNLINKLTLEEITKLGSS